MNKIFIKLSLYSILVTQISYSAEKASSFDTSLTAAQAQEATTKLFEAIEEGDINKVQRAIDEGANLNPHLNPDINPQRPVLFTPLTSAVNKAIVDNNTATVELLLSKGANIDALDNCGLTALMYAAVKSHQPLIHLLLKRGAGINTKSRAQFTALTLSGRSSHTKIPKLLLDKDATISAQDLAFAAMDNNIVLVRLLLDRGGRANINAQSSIYKSTALMEAVRCRHTAIVQLLLNNGATFPFDFILENLRDIAGINHHLLKSILIGLGNLNSDDLNDILRRNIAAIYHRDLSTIPDPLIPSPIQIRRIASIINRLTEESYRSKNTKSARSLPSNLLDFLKKNSSEEEGQRMLHAIKFFNDNLGIN